MRECVAVGGRVWGGGESGAGGGESGGQGKFGVWSEAEK